MVVDLCIEPKDEEIIGSFFNNDLLPASEPGHMVKKELTKHTSKVVNKNRDVREMVKNISNTYKKECTCVFVEKLSNRLPNTSNTKKE